MAAVMMRTSGGRPRSASSRQEPPPRSATADKSYLPRRRTEDRAQTGGRADRSSSTLKRTASSICHRARFDLLLLADDRFVHDPTTELPLSTG